MPTNEKNNQLTHITVTSGLILACWNFAYASELPGVTVTAERWKEADAHTVPISVTNIDGETLRETGTTSLSDLAGRAPGLAVSSFNVGQSTPYIRGIGSNEDGAAGDPSIGVFLDDVYLGRSAAWASDLFGLERIEVLRGPQGTLYGRNVVGGAINLITRKPDEERMRAVDVEHGSLGHRQLRFDVSETISEGVVYAGISGTLKKRDGYLKSHTRDMKHLEQDRQGVRGQLVLFPTLSTELTLSADYAEIDESGPNRHATGELKEVILEPLNPGAANDLLMSWDIDSGTSEGHFNGVTVRIDHELEIGLLTSITAWRESDLFVSSADIFDLDALTSSPGFVPFETPITYGINDYDESSTQLSQEVRISGQNRRVDWLLGAYYFREKTDRREAFALDVLLAPDITFPGGLGFTHQHNITDSHALFGQLGYAIAERWRLTFGARYSRDRKKLRQNGQAGGFLILEDYAVDTSHEWSRITPKLVVDYKVNAQLFSYASYSRGYKSGGFQGQAPTSAVAANPFDQEIADNYEIGLKWRSNDKRLRAHASLFYTNYKDLQVLDLFSPADAPNGDVGVTMTLNAADARSRGIELEWALIPGQGWTLSGSYAWLDAVYTDFFIDENIGFRFTSEVDRDGNRLRNAPKHSAHLSLEQVYALKRSGTLNSRIDWSWQSLNYQDSANQTFASIPAYGLTHLRVAWQPNEALEVAGWIHNLFDKRYTLHNFPVAQTGLATPGLPRTFGITVCYDFGG